LLGFFLVEYSLHFWLYFYSGTHPREDSWNILSLYYPLEIIVGVKVEAPFKLTTIQQQFNFTCMNLSSK